MVFAKEQKDLAIQYQDYADWHIEMIGTRLDLLSGTPSEISGRAASLEQERGMFPDGAIEKAVEENTIKCDAAKGHLFARITKKGHAPVIVTLKR